MKFLKVPQTEVGAITAAAQPFSPHERDSVLRSSLLQCVEVKKPLGTTRHLRFQDAYSDQRAVGTGWDM